MDACQRSNVLISDLHNLDAHITSRTSIGQASLSMEISSVLFMHNAFNKVQVSA